MSVHQMLTKVSKERRSRVSIEGIDQHLTIDAISMYDLI